MRVHWDILKNILHFRLWTEFLPIICPHFLASLWSLILLYRNPLQPCVCDVGWPITLVKGHSLGRYRKDLTPRVYQANRPRQFQLKGIYGKTNEGGNRCRKIQNVIKSRLKTKNIIQQNNSGRKDGVNMGGV